MNNRFSTELDLQIIGTKLAREGLDHETMFVADCLKNIGLLSIDNSFRFKSNNLEKKHPNLVGNSDNNPDFLVCRAVDYLRKIGLIAIDQKLDSAVGISSLLEELIEKYLESIYEEIIWKKDEEKINNSLSILSTFLGEFGIFMAEQQPNSTKGLLKSIYEIGKYSSERRLLAATHGSLLALKKIGTILAKNEEDAIANDAVSYLGNIGILTIKKEMHIQALDSLHYIEEIGEIVVENKMRLTTTGIISNLLHIAKIAIKVDNSDLKQKTLFFLENIGRTLSKKRLESELDCVVFSLKTMGITIIDKGCIGGFIANNEKIEIELRKIVCSLESIGIITSQKKMEHSTERVTNSIKDIGLHASNYKMGDVLYQAKISIQKIVDVSLRNGLFNISKMKYDLEEMNDVYFIYIN